MQFYQKVKRSVMAKNDHEKIIIYTDGSCLGNPGAGGWGALIQLDEEEVVLRGGEPETTNNRMEMTAVLQALKWLKENGKGRNVEIYSDSNLVVQSINKGWKRKKNLDIWEKIDKALTALKNIDIKWYWVKGHSDNHFNERVDKIAVEESMKQPKVAIKKKVKAESGKGYFCKKCNKNVKGQLSYMPDSEMIRVDCEKCGSYIMFAEKTSENIKNAKRRILISKKQLEKVIKIKENRGETVSENDLKKIKTWTKEEADGFIKGDQTLF